MDVCVSNLLSCVPGPKKNQMVAEDLRAKCCCFVIMVNGQINILYQPIVTQALHTSLI